ncbi:AraC family transcriptional regulator [Pseudomaricurvus alkylphenolicus]|jgi:AraC-like DNA-binding protein|uniref:AraC family transcriptional regulator n=1 Tax=Pseudomaricurvus alkylphenolicus TaxID=1306991 RepID=UPI0014232A92|nr:AraC family transcriptional regulator [Pseudomaricurvus alkylphenolicus]NIB38845.1 AraC family transcriptional regulator [Pseudomaricurvus alkylphenolicus]
MFRPTKILHYLNWMQQRGFSDQQVLANTGISADKLNDKHYLIDSWQTQQVIANLRHLTQDEALGFTISESVRFSDLGIMGYALMSARTMREFTELWHTYSHHLVGNMVHPQIWQQDGCWGVTFHETVPLGETLTFCMEEIFTVGKVVAEAATNTPFVFSHLELDYPPPSHEQRYREIMNCPVSFNAGITRVTITQPTLDTPIQHNDDELYALCLQHCQQVMQQIIRDRPLAAKVRQLFLHSQGELPSLESVADQLHISSRTLRRRLQAEGVNFQALINQFRADLAKQYMTQTNLSNQEIGFLLGYQDAKAFSKAFKNWTSQTISSFRQSLGG